MNELLLTDRERVVRWGFTGQPLIYVRVRRLGANPKTMDYYVSVFDERGRPSAGVHLLLRSNAKPECSGLQFKASTYGEGLDLIRECLTK